MSTRDIVEAIGSTVDVDETERAADGPGARRTRQSCREEQEIRGWTVEPGPYLAQCRTRADRMRPRVDGVSHAHDGES